MWLWGIIIVICIYFFDPFFFWFFLVLGVVWFILVLLAARNAPQTPQQMYESGNQANKSHKAHLCEGGVYLLKAGPFYKIGKADVFDRRIKQVRLQLPYEVEVAHLIYTPSPYEVEHWWHERFAHKRMNGEWFGLSDEDVDEFKKYTFIESL
jgi:Meiotically up-regulated gene 113